MFLDVILGYLGKINYACVRVCVSVFVCVAL